MVTYALAAFYNYQNSRKLQEEVYWLGKIRTSKDRLKKNIVAVQEDYMYKESVEIGASAGEHKIP